MQLNELIKCNSNIDIKQLSCSSKEKMDNAIFFCVKGIKYDGHDFYLEAIKNGAKVIVYENNIDTNINDVIFLRVKDVNKVLCSIACKFYNVNSDEFNNVLIGGGYGKRLISEFLFQILNNFEKTAIITSKNIKYDDYLVNNNVTALSLMDNIKYLSRFKSSDVKTVIYEGKPLDLELHKLDFLNKLIFIYSGFSNYAIDYKTSLDQYFDIYNNYFRNLKDSVSIINIDNDKKDEILNSFGMIKITYGTSELAEYQICNINLDLDFTSFTIKHKDKQYNIDTKLLGLENVYYVTAVFIYLRLKSIPVEEIISYLNKLVPINGHYNYFYEFNYNILVDKSYYVDEIKTLTKYVRKNYHNNKIYVVIGCNRYNKQDLKEIVELLASYVNEIIFTRADSWQPLTFDDISRGQKYISSDSRCRSIVIENRKEAIKQSFDLLNKNDLLIILGKGDDNFLFVDGEKEAYESDLNVVKKLLNERKKENNNEI